MVMVCERKNTLLKPICSFSCTTVACLLYSWQNLRLEGPLWEHKDLYEVWYKPTRFDFCCLFSLFAKDIPKGTPSRSIWYDFLGGLECYFPHHIQSGPLPVLDVVITLWSRVHPSSRFIKHCRGPITPCRTRIWSIIFFRFEVSILGVPAPWEKGVFLSMEADHVQPFTGCSFRKSIYLQSNR